MTVPAKYSLTEAHFIIAELERELAKAKAQIEKLETELASRARREARWPMRGA